IRQGEALQETSSLRAHRARHRGDFQPVDFSIMERLRRVAAAWRGFRSDILGNLYLYRRRPFARLAFAPAPSIAARGRTRRKRPAELFLRLHARGCLDRAARSRHVLRGRARARIIRSALRDRALVIKSADYEVCGGIYLVDFF